MAKARNVSRRALLGAAVLGAGFAVGLGSAVATRVAMRYEGEFLPGSKVGGVDISGLTPKQAVDMFDSRWQRYIASPVVFRTPGRDWRPSADEIGIGVDYLTPIRKAYGWGRHGGIFRRGRENAAASALSRDHPIEFTFQRGKLRRYLAGIASRYFRPVVSASLEVQDGEIRLRAGSAGTELDWQSAVDLVKPPGPEAGQQQITIPIKETAPGLSTLNVENLTQTIMKMLEDPIVLDFEGSGWLLDQQTLRDALKLERVGTQITPTFDSSKFEPLFDEIDDRLAIEPSDGSWEYDAESERVVEFVPSIDGRRLDRGSLASGIVEGAKSGNRNVDIPIVGVPASGTLVKDLGIENLIATGESFFFQSPSFRIHNIEVGARIFDGSLIRQGEEFSFNRYLGPIEYDRGFVDGLVIIDDSTVDAIGGGICQVSTTMFRSAFLAGLPIKERHKHLYRVRYYEHGDFPIGFDASIWQPVLDLRFVNDTEGPIMIRTVFSRRRKSLKFEFWGRRHDRTVEISGHHLSDWEDPPPDEWVIDEELPEGTTEQTEWAVKGVFAVLERRVTSATGKVSNSRFSSSFLPWPNRYLVSPDVAKEEAPDVYEEWHQAKAAAGADEEGSTEQSGAETTEETSGDAAGESVEETAGETESVESNEDRTSEDE